MHLCPSPIQAQCVQSRGIRRGVFLVPSLLPVPDPSPIDAAAISFRIRISAQQCPSRVVGWIHGQPSTSASPPCGCVLRMALTVTPIRMDSDVVAELDALAAKQNTTRSELIREAVATMLATKQKGRR